MAMTFDGQKSSCRSDVEKTGTCAKEEVSSSLLGKLAPPFLCYKHIPSYTTCIVQLIILLNMMGSCKFKPLAIGSLGLIGRGVCGWDGYNSHPPSSKTSLKNTYVFVKSNR